MGRVGGYGFEGGRGRGCDGVVVKEGGEALGHRGVFVARGYRESRGARDDRWSESVCAAKFDTLSSRIVKRSRPRPMRCDPWMAISEGVLEQ